MTVKVSMIAAMAKNRVIGSNNQLPWHLPADLKHFKELTVGKPILMGRKTFESLGKPLPQRTNIVVTHNHDYQAEGCVIVHSLSEGLQRAKDELASEAVIIGGADIFAQSLSFAHTMYLTIIHEEFLGDSYFPEFNLDEWQEVDHHRHSKDEKNLYDYSFITYVRR
jgi:dihydrofolate reductase